MLKTKRVYEAERAEDGKRILVDRLWPRGVNKAEAGIDDWVKDIAPSDELRKWFSHAPEKWHEFRKRYAAEMAEPEKKSLLERIAQTASKGDVTLVYAARDTAHNNAVALKELIEERLLRR